MLWAIILCHSRCLALNCIDLTLLTCIFLKYHQIVSKIVIKIVNDKWFLYLGHAYKSRRVFPRNYLLDITQTIFMPLVFRVISNDMYACIISQLIFLMINGNKSIIFVETKVAKGNYLSSFSIC